jgi:uncharacterized protein (TIGR03437 family)
VTLTITGGAQGGSASLSVTPTSVSFTLQNGQPLPPATTALTVTSSGTALNIGASTSTDTSANWLSIQGGGSTPTSLVVSLNSGQFVSGGVVNYPAATYHGSITITAAGASNSPLIVPVTATITGNTSTPLLSMNATPITFTLQNGAAPPSTVQQTLSVSSTATPLAFSVVSSTTAGGNWLTVSSAGGVTPATFTVGVNLAAVTSGNLVSLAPAAYRGSVTVSANGAANSPLTVPVILNVMPPAPQLSVSNAQLTFSFQTGATPPPAQSVVVSASDGSAVPLSASAEAAGNWLTAQLSSTTTSATLKISVSVGGMAPGTYQGEVLVTGSGASNSPQTISVMLVVTAAPPTIEGVVNAASSLSGGVAPGEIVSIYGSALGPDSPVSMSPPVSGVVGAVLAGTRVWFNDLPAPLLFVSSKQVGAVVPYKVADQSSVQIQVEVGGVKSPALSVAVVDTAPGIFTLNQAGSGPGAVLNQDYSLNSASNPAPAGSVVMIYATGAGATNPVGVDGLITSEALSMPIQPVSVTIGGQQAEVLYAGSAPALIAGALQVNAKIPSTVAHGAVPVVLSIGLASSGSNVTIAVQ